MTLTATVCLVFALELAVVGWSESSLRRFTHPGRAELFDLGMFVLVATGLSHLAIIIGSLGGSVLINRFTGWATSAVGHPLLQSELLSVVLYVLAADFIYYWLHRAFHTKWLWWIHKVHHSAVDLSPLTLYRNHPANWAVDSLWSTLPLAVLYVSPSTAAIYLAVLMGQTLLIHSVIPWSYGRVGQWLLVSPLAHRIHHSFEMQYRDRNFGILLPIWDRMFGTASFPEPQTVSIAKYV